MENLSEIISCCAKQMPCVRKVLGAEERWMYRQILFDILRNLSRGKIPGGVWQAQNPLKESGVEWLPNAICIEMGWCSDSPRGWVFLQTLVGIGAIGGQ